MVKVKFTDDVKVEDGDGKVIQKFRAGQVVELNGASARHWINRSLATRVVAHSGHVKKLVRDEGAAEVQRRAAEAKPADPTKAVPGETKAPLPFSARGRASRKRK